MGAPSMAVTKAAEKTVIQISGSIDESFSTIKSSIPADPILEFNLKSIKSINSTGIREWINVMNQLKKSNLSFTECPKVFIDQANMVSGFLPAGSRVISFYVPYFCEDIESEKMVLYTEGKDFTGNSVQVKNEIKDADGNIYELDVIESKYFKFLKG